MAILKVYGLGTKGVNIDSDPISIEDTELRLAQNAVRDILGNDSGLRKRPGLAAYNTNLASSVILGGIGVPVVNLSPSGAGGSGGILTIYLGRGPL